MRAAVRLVLAAVALALPASAAASGPVEIRHVDQSGFPLLRVTALVPPGSNPGLIENGRPAAYLQARELGKAGAILLAVDNSASMRGRPLHEAKRAAGAFLAQRTGATGLVAFGREALLLTRVNEPVSDVARTLEALAPQTEVGTSLYDAVRLSVSRLVRVSDGARILVLLTDGRDVGSRSSLSGAIAAAQSANVVVYPIAAGSTADRATLGKLASETGGRLFDATDLDSLSATYRALGRELDRTWQLSYLTEARPGDTLTLDVRAAGTHATAQSRIAGGADGSGVLPSSIARNAATATAVVLLVALLLGAAGLMANRRLRKSEVSRLVEAHVKGGQRTLEQAERSGRFESLLDWTERSLDELPGSPRLAVALERSGLKLRRGYLPYLAGFAGLALMLLVTIAGGGPILALLAMVVGLASPLAILRVAASRRTKAFDRQLPDVLATIASTLRAGHGLRPALRAVADDSTPPASEEFARVLGEERLGRPLDSAIAAMCERIGSADMEYVATAVNVHSRVGGSLAGLFDTLSETVRERQRHARKVRALTSMGRMSAMILVALPIGLGALLTMISPSYMAPLYTTSTGQVLIAMSFGSMAIAGLILNRIVSVKF